MKAEGLKYFTDAPIMVVGFLLFFACFLGFVFWVYRRGSESHYSRIARFPLNEPDRTKKEDSHVALR
jgi:cbb3-type cytochrome oxidase subunit 3